jgi:hypothetical protein
MRCWGYTGAMFSIRSHPLPEHALLASYRRDGSYTDCFVTEIDRPVTQVEYVATFYTAWLFRIERWILAIAVRRPSTDVQARRVATGSDDGFAAWRVEARTEDQLLMCDFVGRTRSWFMTESIDVDGRAGTRLYFGSAVVPIEDAHGNRRMGFAFGALLGFHKLYSIALLATTRARLRRIA